MTAETFTDNWAYLRTELNWLDRMLATAIARQRKDVKEVSRVAQSRADLVTSHWWKGLLNLEGTIAGDSPAEIPRAGGGKNYQQQMESRILAAQKRGVVLGLPALCQTLKLTTFEKNLVLIALAPEVSRRYGRIYNFLQDEQLSAPGLPTIDLILRLLCRNDSEWRAARLSLTADSTLVQHNVVVLPTAQREPFLSHAVKLADPLVEYLLADVPQFATLERLLQRPSITVNADQFTPDLDTWTPERAVAPLSLAISSIAPATEDLWAQLVLPDALIGKLGHLCDRVQYGQQVDECWGFNRLNENLPVGAVTVLSGGSGRGKTLAARAIAQTLQVPLKYLDLALIHSSNHVEQIQHLMGQAPVVLLLKSAHIWFGENSPSSPELRQLLHQRQHSYAITLLSVNQPNALAAIWQKAFSPALKFPFPSETSRLKIWRQTLPTIAQLNADINWQELAQWSLNGKEIQAIARDAAILAAAEANQLGMKHLLQTYKNLGAATRRTPRKAQAKPR